MQEVPSGCPDIPDSRFENPDGSDSVDISVVIPYRHSQAYNALLEFTLQTLIEQSLPRHRFTIVLTEQDTSPRVGDRVNRYVDRYIFGWSDRPFNRGWGLNMGFAGNPARYYCCFDVDFLVDRDFLARQCARMRGSSPVLRPYRWIRNLTEEETRNVCTHSMALNAIPLPPAPPTKSVGGILVFRAHFYRRIGGHLEEFEGWGYDDTLMAKWCKKLGAWSEGDDLVFHLWHPPHADANKKSALPNKATCDSCLDWTKEQIYSRGERIVWGDPERYRKASIKAYKL